MKVSDEVLEHTRTAAETGSTNSSKATLAPNAAPIPDLDAVIVNYNTYDDTIHCVDRLLDTGEIQPAAIHVVDNQSPDASGPQLASTLPEAVNFIQSPINAGFGSGVNIGARAGSARHILILNPDCYPAGPGLGAAVRYLDENPHVGMVGLSLRYPDGTLQYSARRFYTMLGILVRRTPLKGLYPGTLINRRHLMADKPQDKAFPTDWVIGTGVIIRRSLFDALGGMDETYFLYMEDVDLCMRVHIAGYEVHALPTVELVHAHRRASSRGFFSQSHRMHLRSLLRFARKFGLPLLRSPRLSRIKARYATFTADKPPPA